MDIRAAASTEQETGSSALGTIPLERSSVSSNTRAHAMGGPFHAARMPFHAALASRFAPGFAGRAK
jgi:hypothetical protein